MELSRTHLWQHELVDAQNSKDKDIGYFYLTEQTKKAGYVSSMDWTTGIVGVYILDLFW